MPELSVGALCIFMTMKVGLSPTGDVDFVQAGKTGLTAALPTGDARKK